MGGGGGVKEGSLSALGSSLHSSGQREAGALGPWCEKTSKWRGEGATWDRAPWCQRSWS